MSDANERNTPSFEEAMQQLSIVTEMEQGELLYLPLVI